MDPVIAADKSFNLFQFIASEGGITSAILVLLYSCTLLLVYKLGVYFCDKRNAEFQVLVNRNKEISENTIKAFDKNEILLRETIASREKTAITLGEMSNAISAIPGKIENIILRSAQVERYNSHS